MRAPVVLFVYKRKDKTQQCLEALDENRLAEETDLLIFADGYKGENDRKQVLEVRDYIEQYSTISKFRKVFIYKSEENRGLANSVISGVTFAMENYGKAIVVEDDLITSVDFLEYMNGGLDFYENDLRYGSISAYTYPMKILRHYQEDIYVTRKGDCWGWGTWKNRWDNVDWDVKNYSQLINDKKFCKDFSELQNGFDKMLIDWHEGRIDSWAVRWCLHLYLVGQWTVYPIISRTRNIGLDDSGTNCGNDYIFDRNIVGQDKPCNFKFLVCDKKLEKKSADYTKQNAINLLKRIVWKIKKV